MQASHWRYPSVGALRGGESAASTPAWPIPFLHSLGNSMAYHPNFDDIKMGNNAPESAPSFSAGRNWDYPTGWGSTQGSNLVMSLQE